jgi:hypothetical protein
MAYLGAYAVALALSATGMLLATPCAADEGADHTTGVWMAVQASGDLGDRETSRWRFAIDAQARYFDLGSGVSQWLIRPAVGYSLGGHTRVWAGFGRFRVRDREGRSLYENRPWQQIDWQLPDVAGGRLQFRLRLEQRNLESADDTRWALRFLADYQRPVSLLGADRLILAVEPFFDLNRSDWGGGSGISQHRLVAGLAWPLRPGLDFEAGYMNQYFHAEEGLDRSNHLAVLRLRLRY